MRVHHNLHYGSQRGPLASCGQRHAYLKHSRDLSKVDCLDCLDRAEKRANMDIRIATAKLNTIYDQRLRRREEDNE